MFPLSNPVKHYDWGHPTRIPEFLGEIPSDGQPVAELWMGTLPGGPSLIQTPEGMQDLRSVCPQGLPFLFKVLAARRALSIQAHPDLEQARTGFFLENERGIPLGDPRRNYKDPNPKPEFLVALDTPFWGLAGFRDPQAIHGDLADLAGRTSIPVPLLDQLRRALDQGGLRAMTRILLEADPGPWRQCEPALAQAMAASPSPLAPWFSRLLADFPGDPSVLFTLILNLFRLDPGQALFIPAGCMHAYLEGFGLELMAASDNVLRGGLTPKAVDREELDRIVVFDPTPLQVLDPVLAGSGEEVFIPAVPDFRLGRLQGDRTFDLGRAHSPWILLVTEGTARILQDGQCLDLRRGESAVLLPRDGVETGAGTGEIRATVSGTLYRAWSGR